MSAPVPLRCALKTVDAASVSVTTRACRPRPTGPAPLSGQAPQSRGPGAGLSLAGGAAGPPASRASEARRPLWMALPLSGLKRARGALGSGRTAGSVSRSLLFPGHRPASVRGAWTAARHGPGHGRCLCVSPVGRSHVHLASPAPVRDVAFSQTLFPRFALSVASFPPPAPLPGCEAG